MVPKSCSRVGIVAALSLAVGLSALVAQSPEKFPYEREVVCNGKKVDLSAVVDWIHSGKKGKQPMAHWKEMRVVGCDRVNGIYWLSTVQIEGREEIVLFVDLPRRVVNIYNETVAALNRADSTQRRAAAAADAAAVANARDTDNPYVSVGEFGLYARRRAQIVADLQGVASRQSDAAVQQYVTMPERARVLAYFTGRKVGKGQVEVWDCGRSNP